MHPLRRKSDQPPGKKSLAEGSHKSGFHCNENSKAVCYASSQLDSPIDAKANRVTEGVQLTFGADGLIFFQIDRISSRSGCFKNITEHTNPTRPPRTPIESGNSMTSG